MNQANQPQFRPRVIFATTLITLAVVVAFALYGISHTGSDHYKYLFPLLVVVWLIGAKFAAPAIPLIQVIVAGFAIVLIHIGAELTHWPPALIVGEKIIEGVCVLGFGAYWVRKGYIPGSANHWPE